MNNAKSEGMFTTAMFYTMVSIIFAIIAIATKKLLFLDISMWMFIASVLSMAASMMFDSNENQGLLVSFTSFVLMVPFIIFISIVGGIFHFEQDEGGDYDDEP